MKAAGAIRKSPEEIGRLVGKAASVDPKLADEILSFWRSVPQQQGDQEFNGFMNGLLVDCRKDIDAVFSRLAMVERLWKEEIPGWRFNGADPFASAWALISWDRPAEPEVWRRVAKLSPRMQVRLINGARMHFGSHSIGNEAWQKESREASKGSPLTHHAFRWFLEKHELEEHPKTRSDGLVAVGLLEAMKAAGATPEELLVFVEDVFDVLYQLDNVADVLRRTPLVLEDLKVFPKRSGEELSVDVFDFWYRMQSELERENKGTRQDGKPILVHPEETKALLKFIVARLPAGKLDRDYSQELMNQMLLDLGDDDLINSWRRASENR